MWRCALCDGHIIQTSRHSIVAMPPRKYARIDPVGKQNNTLGEYAIVMVCGIYGTKLRMSTDKSYDECRLVNCNVPTSLPSNMAERYSGNLWQTIWTQEHVQDAIDRCMQDCRVCLIHCSVRGIVQCLTC